MSEMCDLKDVSFRELMYERVALAVGGGISVMVGHEGVATSVLVRAFVDGVCGCCDRFERGGAEVGLGKWGFRGVAGGGEVSCLVGTTIGGPEGGFIMYTFWRDLYPGRVQSVIDMAG